MYGAWLRNPHETWNANREKTKRKFPENKYRTQNNQVRIQLLKSWKKIFLSSAQAPQWGWLRRISNFIQSRSFSQPGHNAAQASLASVANVCTEPNWSGHIRTAEILLNLFAPDGIDQNILVVTCTFADRHFYARAFGSEHRCVIEGNFDLTRVIVYVGLYKGSMADALIEGLLTDRLATVVNLQSIPAGGHWSQGTQTPECESTCLPFS